ncbi:lipopolysaccharide biosynthesis protein [Dongia deserti]|uniref:lipopolysaccharide biosynthesis protein n=1 Tax=Dongia deserti TaxID=2268030 RepID=UPI000E652A1D|nr:lipopolysaccharide biosynthesis protein [Dongia deserti]
MARTTIKVDPFMTILSGKPPVPQKLKRRTELRNPIDPLDDQPATYDDTLRKKTRWSILWTVLRILSDQVFAFIVFVVLARLLSPADFGIYAIAQAVAEIGRAIAIGGMVQNIPRAKKLTPALADTVFWTNLTSSLVLAFAILLLAPPIMNMLELSHATGPVQGLGFVLPIAALGATHMSLRLREFGHKSLALRSVISGTIGGAAGIAAAVTGFGIWALVVQRLVTEATNTLVSWQAYPWVPGRNFSKEQLRATWAFGFNIAVQQILSLLPRRAMDLILGSMIGAAAVGLNRTARRTNELVLHGTVNPFTVVALQTLSRLQSDSTELIKAYRWMVSKSAMLSCPALVGLGVLAPEAVPALFGDKWEVSGKIVQIFSFMVVPYALNSFTSPVLMALGRGATLRTFALFQLITTIIFALAAAPFGLLAVAAATVLRAYLALPFQLWMLRSASGLKPQDALSAIARPLLASLMMGAVVWVLMAVLQPQFERALVPLVLCVITGMAVYGVLIYAISEEARKMAHGQLKAVRARFRKA